MPAPPIDLSTLFPYQNTLLESILSKLELFRMATKEDFDVVLNRIDAAEVAVKTKIDAMKAEIVALQEQIKGLGLDATTEANILASLDKQAAFLEALVAPEAPATPVEPAPAA